MVRVALPPIDLAELLDEEKDRILAGLLTGFDRELGDEVVALLRTWADASEAAARDGAPNPHASRSPADYRRLADAIDEHRAYLDAQRAA
jgi:hypothetical protein